MMVLCSFIVASAAAGLLGDGKRRVLATMRDAVARSRRHPLADGELRLGAREFLVVVGTSADDGSDVVVMDEGAKGSCTLKCHQFREQFLSALS